MICNALSRRGFVVSAAAALATAGTRTWGETALAAGTGRPNSLINGVQIGVITYSFRTMPDQSAQALLGYCLDCGINAVELMGDPAEAYAGIPVNPNAAAYWRVMSRNFMTNPPPMTAADEKEKARVLAAQAIYQKKAAAWRATASIDRFRQLRKLYNDAGVHIYAFKPSTFETYSTDAEVDYGMRAAKALGATSVNVEMPTDPAQTQRLGDAAVRHGLIIGYHEHLQATPTLWDQALAQSKGNGINLDLGHFVAADNFDALAFIEKYHAHIVSMHLKDRKNKAHGGANLSWGLGDTPLVAALRLMRDRKYSFPAAIELEYDIPSGSDAVKEVRKCLKYCRDALQG